MSENQFLTFKTKSKTLRIDPQDFQEFIDKCLTYAVKCLGCDPKIMSKRNVEKNWRTRSFQKFQWNLKYFVKY